MAKDNDELNLNIDDSDKNTRPGLIAKLKEKLSLKLLIIISAVIVLIVGGCIFFIVFTGEKDSDDEPEKTDKTTTEESTMAPPVILFDDIVTLNVVEIKLSDLGGEKVFTVGIHCKIDQQELRDELQEKDAEVVEVITVILRSKTYAELQGVDGKILLRNEIIKHLNEILETGRIMNLFFYEYIIL